MKRADDTRTWRPLTRRSFVALLGGAAAALAIRRPIVPEVSAAPVVAPASPAAAPAARKTRWIGHC